VIARPTRAGLSAISQEAGMSKFGSRIPGKPKAALDHWLVWVVIAIAGVTVFAWATSA
jgi:hypothetical protein